MRLQRFENSYEIGQSNPREENQRQQISGVTYTLLLLGSVKFGLLASLHLPHAELQIRECAFHTHEVDYLGKKTLNGVTALLNTLKNMNILRMMMPLLFILRKMFWHLNILIQDSLMQ